MLHISIFFDVTKQNVSFNDIYKIRMQSYFKLVYKEIKMTDQRAQIKDIFDAIIILWML